MSSISDRKSRLVPQITRKGTFVDGRHLFRAAGKEINTMEQEKWNAGRPVKQHLHGVGNLCATCQPCDHFNIVAQYKANFFIGGLLTVERTTS